MICCSLPPYYSLELNLISSTSHSNLFRSPGSRILIICCISRAKMHIWSWKIDESWGFGVFFLILLFSQLWMVLRWSDSQFKLRGLISCPGLLLNPSGLEFHIYSDFSLHIMSICRPWIARISLSVARLELSLCMRKSLYVIFIFGLWTRHF